jgi:hypothetical protein
VYELVEVVGCCVCKHEAGEGVWAKKPKLSRRGSISGAPYRTVKGDDAEWWCGGVYEAAAAVGLCARETRGREGVLGQIPKPSRRGSISGAPYRMAKGDDAEWWCGGVYEAAAAVGLCARETRGREGVLGQIPKPSCCGSV